MSVYLHSRECEYLSVSPVKAHATYIFLTYSVLFTVLLNSLIASNTARMVMCNHLWVESSDMSVIAFS
jgi:hypothetical protein